MDKWRLILMVWQVVNTIANEILVALLDGVLDGPEILRILKSGIMTLRLSGISSQDLDKLQLITNKMEYDSLDFEDGDGILYGPKELLEKLKIDFND